MPAVLLRLCPGPVGSPGGLGQSPLLLCGSRGQPMLISPEGSPGCHLPLAPVWVAWGFKRCSSCGSGIAENSLQLLKAADYLTLKMPQGYSDKCCHLSTAWSLPEARKYQRILKIQFSDVLHCLGMMNVPCPINVTVMWLCFSLP